ncbi:MAG: putative copper resistance protein D [Pseudohongiellaceae bacterium]|jgi:putative copper resistance protein D
MNAFVVPNLWEIASLLAKLSVYGGMASVAGASLFLVLYCDNRRQSVVPVISYCLFGALLGFQGAALNFPIQIGMINDDGFAGMLDWSMAKLLLDSQLGDVTLYRVLGFAVAIAVSGFFLFKSTRLSKAPAGMFFRPLFTLNALVLMGLALSFPLAGHVSVLNDWARFALALHVLAFAFWIGLLWPFMVLANTPDLDLLQTKLRQFGRHAIGVLVVLGSAGAVILWQLFGSLSEFFGSAYGLTMTLKLLIVIAIISIAAFNKLRLVPAIVEAGGAQRFRQSVKIEMVVAAAILVLTSYLSTLVGPMPH